MLRKAASFCAYQERTHREVRLRLQDWDTWGDEAEEIIAWLIAENYVNEERFAKVFAGSKFRVKQWGRQKILFELKNRGLSPYCVNKGMAEIEDDAYLETLTDLLNKKRKELVGQVPIVVQQKMARFAMGKGFETDLIWDIIRAMKM